LNNDLIKIILGIVIGIFIAAQFKGCDSINLSPVKEKVTIKTHVDTIHTSSIDTVFVQGPEKIVRVNVPVYVGRINDTTSEYVHNINESDLKAKIFTQSTCSVLGQRLEYSVICPVITKSDTIKINTVDSIFSIEYVEKKVNSFYVGVEAGYIKNLGIINPAANFTWKMKNNYQVYYEYSLSLDKSLAPDHHRLGVKLPITIGKK